MENPDKLREAAAIALAIMDPTSFDGSSSQSATERGLCLGFDRSPADAVKVPEVCTRGHLPHVFSVEEGSGNPPASSDSATSNSFKVMETYYGRVETAFDAVKLMEACRLGALPCIQQRLPQTQRSCVRSGSNFVWDENQAGMRRWTDGLSWGSSRISGKFLIYREIEGKRSRGSGGGRRGVGKPGRGRNKDREIGEPEGYKCKTDGLMKQTFSIKTFTGQHLHLISYYSQLQPESTGLQRPSTDPNLRHITPSKDVYPEWSLDNSNPKLALTNAMREQKSQQSTIPQAPLPHQNLGQMSPKSITVNGVGSPMEPKDTPPLCYCAIGSDQCPDKSIEEQHVSGVVRLAPKITRPNVMRPPIIENCGSGADQTACASSASSASDILGFPCLSRADRAISDACDGVIVSLGPFGNSLLVPPLDISPDGTTPMGGVEGHGPPQDIGLLSQLPELQKPSTEPTLINDIPAKGMHINLGLCNISPMPARTSETVAQKTPYMVQQHPQQLMPPQANSLQYVQQGFSPMTVSPYNRSIRSSCSNYVDPYQSTGGPRIHLDLDGDAFGVFHENQPGEDPSRQHQEKFPAGSTPGNHGPLRGSCGKPVVFTELLDSTLWMRPSGTPISSIDFGTSFPSVEGYASFNHADRVEGSLSVVRGDPVPKGWYFDYAGLSSEQLQSGNGIGWTDNEPSQKHRSIY